MSVYIRKASAGDEASIRSLVRQAGLNPLGLHWHNFIVAEGAGGIVACGQLRPHRRGSAELASLVVSPAHHGSGIGGELVRTLIRIGPAELYLMCDAKMRGYYERFGFRVIGAGDLPREMRTLFQVGLAATWVMRKIISESVRVLAMYRR